MKNQAPELNRENYLSEEWFAFEKRDYIRANNELPRLTEENTSPASIAHIHFLRGEINRIWNILTDMAPQSDKEDQ